MSSPQQIRTEITQQIIAALEAGVVPWRRPWRLDPNAGAPSNLVSRKPYHGINILLLELHSMQHHLASKWWGTFAQVKGLGGSVKRRPDDVQPGQWGCHIVLFRPVSRLVVDKATGEEKRKEFRLMRYFTVFNADQCEGIERFQMTEEMDVPAFSPDFSRVEQVIAASKAEIRFGGEQAFYTCPPADHITMPRRSRFLNDGAYYETLLHELAHWAEVRTGWDSTKEGYATGELVAELAACFLATELGVPHGEPLHNHAAYIGGWLQAMRGDPNVIFRAASQASKVTDFILTHVRAEQAAA